MGVLQNDIYVGSVSAPLYHFTAEQIKDDYPQGVFTLDVIGNNLSVDTFSIPLKWTEDDFYDGFITSDDEEFILANDEELTVLVSENATLELKSFLKELPFGTPVWWYVGGEFYTKGYLKSVDRTGKFSFKLTCVSGVGLLDATMHVGDMYRAASISDVLASIIGNAFTYEVSEAVQLSTVYGHLPYDTCRNNLHRLLFATGAALHKGDEDTDYIIDYLSETVTDVPASRVALQGSVDYQLPSNRVEVTEHAFFYLASSPTETLFDNTRETVADHLTIIFDKPVFVGDSSHPTSLAPTGSLTINASGVNYAVVTGQGTLTGQYYTHTTQIDVLENNPNNEPERVRRVETNELVTALNARNVSRRVLSYYQSAKQVKAKILLDGERCGQLLRMTDAFGDLTQAYLSKMDTLVTSVIGATCQLVEGFEPGANGNNFLHCLVIDAAWIAENGSTWTVPDNVNYLRVVPIGGGTGGQGGYNGQSGLGQSAMASGSFQDGYAYAYANGQQAIPQGGSGGSAGSPGKVLVIEHAVTPGEQLSFSVGVGGAGGAKNGGSGSAGTPTTVSSPSLGTVSSESGLVTNGYMDPFTGDIFAAHGSSGLRGGNGGRTDTADLYGNNGKNGLPGEGVHGYPGGAGGIGVDCIMDIPMPNYAYAFASGGAGGGAAYGANGGDGGSASHFDRPMPWAKSGAGGKGADAASPSKGVYGSGGAGGNGGGAGGNAGAARNGQNQPIYSYTLTIGAAGAAGFGSLGGAGGDGVLFIYY